VDIDRQGSVDGGSHKQRGAGALAVPFGGTDVKDHPHVTLTDGVCKLQDMAQKICTSKEAQKEAEMLVQVARLVSSHTLP